MIGLSAFMLLVSTAMAGFHVEPYLGYGKGSEGNHTVTASDQNPADYSGMGFGARLGFNYLGLLIGGTYDAQGLEQTDDDDPTDVIDFKGTNMGAFLGYEFPLGLRLWLSYYMSASFEIDGTNDGSNVGAEFSGSGTAFGLGYSIIPMMLSLNVEYKSFAYDEFTPVTGPVVQLTGNNEAKVSYIFVSISAPLGF